MQIMSIICIIMPSKWMMAVAMESVYIKLYKHMKNSNFDRTLATPADFEWSLTV